MAFQISPGIRVTENDLTTVVPAVSSTVGAFAGAFRWGPAEYPILVDTENFLVNTFGKPDADTYKSFFTAANFLSYASALWNVRCVPLTALNATDGSNGLLIKNKDIYDAGVSNTVSAKFSAKYPGALGNSLDVVIFDAGWDGSTDVNVTYGNETISVNDYLGVGAPGTSNYATALDQASINDELHVLVIDRAGRFTGVAGTVLERFTYLSKLSDAKNPDGTTNYYVNVINEKSQYIWWMAHPGRGGNTSSSSSTLWNIDWGSTIESIDGFAFDTLADTGFGSGVYFASLAYGACDNSLVDDSELQTGYALFADGSQYDISLILSGAAPVATAQYIIDNLCEVRKDCVGFFSPEYADVVGVSNISTQLSNVIDFFENSLNRSTSYGFMDSGWKYQYDRYNDVNRWVPLNGDTAGLCARTDETNDPWWSPAGPNRGLIKNVIKLAFNPRKADRDELYKRSINPVVAFPGQGTQLFGDKTMLDRPSAFQEVGIRRLFIVMEKAISSMAKFNLFEFNDQLTRSMFKGRIDPFLRDVQGRRGVTDFRTICDESNNPGSVVDRREFVGDIYVKPNHSINFITLNFTAVGTDVSFNEVGG